MSDQIDIRTDDMPTEMQCLLRDYPRDSWDAHPGFREKTRNWLGAHQMFRQLGRIVKRPRHCDGTCFGLYYGSARADQRS